MPFPAQFSDLDSGAELSYTPAWTSAGTQPSLGNGSLTGNYAYLGSRLIYARIFLSMGSTTTFGTGAYFLTLPTLTFGLGAGALIMTQCSLFDSSASTLPGPFTARIEDSTTPRISLVYPATWPNGTFSNVTNTAPFTWAQSDSIQATFIYPGVM